MVSSAARRSRIIPAYAGSTRTLYPTMSSTKDHPRIRGEHRCRTGGSCRRVGSSPHTRGAPSQLLDGGRQLGIIPAYAGSTATSTATTNLTKDHPRIRGEHGDNADYMMKSRGSSPHTRGARPCAPFCPGAPRIIPAYAGSTDVICMGWATGPDHPRIRGEHGSVGDGAIHLHGSSPHTRGAPGRRRR